MALIRRAKLSWLLVSGGVLCAGQSERVIAMQWADYYAAVYRDAQNVAASAPNVHQSGWTKFK